MTALIASNLFTKGVHSPDHPAVKRFKEILATIAECRHARIVGFSIDKDIALIKIDNDGAAFQITEDIMDTVGIRPAICGPQNADYEKLRRKVD